VLAAGQQRKFRKEGFKYSHPPNLSPAILEHGKFSNFFGELLA